MSISSTTGMRPGPFHVGVTSTQFDDHSRTDPDMHGPRRLQTEIWYPAGAEAAALPKTVFSDYLGRGVIPGSIQAAEASDAIGGYREGLTIAELDASWPSSAVRDARPLDCSHPWPLVIFSHGSGAYRASYMYWTEFLASHGFVVAACDHLGSARYTQVDGEVVKPGGKRSERSQMEADRPVDMMFLLDSMQALAAGKDSRFAGRIDTSRTALTGMSFGGWASAAALELAFADDRVKAAIMQCPSIAFQAPDLSMDRTEKGKPVMMQIGIEDTVIGERGNEACRAYVAQHAGPAYLVEIKRGGHVSFTSCELYNPEYGNGIGESKSLTAPGTNYYPLPISEQHGIINSYGLAFLNTHLRGGTAEGSAEFDAEYLTANHFGEAELAFTSRNHVG